MAAALQPTPLAYALQLLVWLAICLTHTSSQPPYVKVYQFMINHWGDSYWGDQQCGPHIHCEWVHADHLHGLTFAFESSEKTPRKDIEYSKAVTLSLYNIHSWWERTRTHAPKPCELRTNLTMAESEESRIRYNHLFEPSFKHYDGFSTTHPQSSVQRVYVDAFLNASHFLPTMHNFSDLIKAASYVASDCHRRDGANSNRDGVVHQLRQGGFRVDGLGRCMHMIGPEGVTLPNSHNSRYNLVMKRETISKFMFNLAFENSIEAGYVTEKPFDALVSGTVPVYLGDDMQLKKLLPHPKAAIFVADFDNDHAKLAEYLIYLTKNETAYEEHRAWRKNFNYDDNVRNKPLLKQSWPCRICEWAVENAEKPHKRTRDCELFDKKHSVKVEDYEGKALRGDGPMIYRMEGGLLRWIPDIETFYNLKLEVDNVLNIEADVFKKMKIGEPYPSTKTT